MTKDNGTASYLSDWIIPSSEAVFSFHLKQKDIDYINEKG